MPTIDNPTVKRLAELGVNSPEEVRRLFEQVRERFDAEARRNSDPASWNITRQMWLGRKSGVLTQITENWLKPSPMELKRAVGESLNNFKEHVEVVLAKAIADLESEQPAASVKDRVDLSLPGVIRPTGSHHLIRQVFQEVEDIFFSIGFSIVEGPEIETPYYNFEALNIPEFHPVRDDMDTFYLELPKGAPGPLLLRTHTSPVQIHTMEKRQPPVRVIVPGKVYRRDNPDATHSFMFHQVEGLAVDNDITFCDFKGTIDYFVRKFFGKLSKHAIAPAIFRSPSLQSNLTCRAFSAGVPEPRKAAAPAASAKARVGSNFSARAWSIPRSTAS